MTGLKHTMAAIPGGSTRYVYGTAYWDGARWYASIGGNLLDCRWQDPIQIRQNGPIVVAITNDGQGQSTALVMGGYADQPRPSTGTVQGVIPAGVSTRLEVEGEDGITYTTDRFVGSYSPGDPVYLTWDAGAPTVLGVIGALTVVPESVPPLPPATALSGEVTAVATASDTFGVGGWGRWASSQRGGEDVYTGTWGTNTVTGAWFYGAPNPVLAGKTVTRIRFKLPARLSVGTPGTATVHLYAHTSTARPGGDVTRTVGPFDYDVPQGFGGGYIELPLTFGPVLAAGGGISISGNPYAGFQGRLSKYQDRYDPESGKIQITWSV